MSFPEYKSGRALTHLVTSVDVINVFFYMLYGTFTCSLGFKCWVCVFIATFILTYFWNVKVKPFNIWCNSCKGFFQEYKDQYKGKILFTFPQLIKHHVTDEK